MTKRDARRYVRAERRLRGTPNPTNDAGSIAVAEAMRLMAQRRDRAVIAVVIPLPNGEVIAELMTVRHWGHDGPPHCVCGNDTPDHLCAHIRMIGHVLELHATTPLDYPERGVVSVCWV